MKEITEKIVKDFINRLNRASKSELRNEFIDKNNRPQMESITFDELFDNFGRGIDMNFFPSENKGACCEVAMFVSFHKPIFGLKFKKDIMISLDDVLKKLVQQVLGTCYPKNQKIILLTDKVDTEVFEPWLGNLRAIKRMGMEIEIIYLRSDGSTEVVNKLVGL
jgi:hypothetical protein